MNKKILFLLFFAALVILFVLALVISLMRPRAENDKLPVMSPTPTSIQRRPLATPTLTPKIKVSTSLEVLGVTPNPAELVRIDKKLTIIFNKPINPEEFDYELTPSVKVTTGLDTSATKFYISGDPFWPNDEGFTLIIKADTKAQDGSSLQNDYTLEFKTGIPEGI